MRMNLYQDFANKLIEYGWSKTTSNTLINQLKASELIGEYTLSYILEECSPEEEVYTKLVEKMKLLQPLLSKLKNKHQLKQKNILELADKMLSYKYITQKDIDFLTTHSDSIYEQKVSDETIIQTLLLTPWGIELQTCLFYQIQIIFTHGNFIKKLAGLVEEQKTLKNKLLNPPSPSIPLAYTITQRAYKQVTEDIKNSIQALNSLLHQLEIIHLQLRNHVVHCSALSISGDTTLDTIVLALQTIALNSEKSIEVILGVDFEAITDIIYEAKGSSQIAYILAIYTTAQQFLSSKLSQSKVEIKRPNSIEYFSLKLFTNEEPIRVEPIISEVSHSA